MSSKTKATLTTVTGLVVVVFWITAGQLVPEKWTPVVYFGPMCLFLLVLLVLTAWQALRDWFEKRESEDE